MAQTIKRKTNKQSAPVTQIFLGVAILLVVMLIVAIFTSRNVRSDKTILLSSEYENIPTRHYMYFFNSMRFEYENEWASYGTGADEMVNLWNTVEDGLTWGDHLKLYALETTKSIYTEFYLAKQAGFNETPEVIASTGAEIDGVVQSIFSASNTPNTDFYNAYGLTIDEMKALQIVINLVNEWRGSVYDKTDITESAALAYFDENAESFQTVVARHVLIATSDMEEDEKAAAEELANDLLQQIADGADIQELAEIYSDDRDSNGILNSGGEYEFGRNEMVPEFEEWAFSAEVGDTGVVETDYGYHVMQLMRGPTAFEDARDDVIEALRGVESNSYIENAIASAGFDWKLNDSAFNKIKIK